MLEKGIWVLGDSYILKPLGIQADNHKQRILAKNSQLNEGRGNQLLKDLFCC